MSAQDVLRLARVRHLVRSGEARRIRERSSLTQGELARALGVSVATVSRWENPEDHGPNAAHALTYLDLLDAIEAQAGELVPA